jgi:hypothetical protein
LDRVIGGGGGGGRWCPEGVTGREDRGDEGSVLLGDTFSRSASPFLDGRGGTIGFGDSTGRGLAPIRVEEPFLEGELLSTIETKLILKTERQLTI